MVVDMEDGRRWRRHVDQLRPRTVKPQVNPGGWGEEGMEGSGKDAKRVNREVSHTEQPMLGNESASEGAPPTEEM